jgi:hypothetical protein
MASDSSPTERAYVRFNVGSYGGNIVSAKLRLYVTNGAGGATGTIRRMSNTSWSESAMTYNTRASIDGAQVASFNNLAVGTWIEADVTSIVTAPGAYSFGLSQTGSDGVDFATRESSTSSQRPQLIITTR